MGKVTDKHGKRLVAYSVQGYEYGCIVFASNSATARRNGASELGCDWEDIESCRRASWADSYAQDRRVPPLVMINHGWWFECCHCGCQVSDDSSHDDDDGNEIPHEPVADGQFVYCSPACLAEDQRERAERKARKEAAKKAALDTFPGVDVKWTDDSEPAKVSFTFPGGTHQVTWTVGESAVMVCLGDVEAWLAFKATLPQHAV